MKIPDWLKQGWGVTTTTAVVVSGLWFFFFDKTVALKPGSFMKHPMGAHHFDGAKDEEVIVQLMGMGPSTTTKIDPTKGLFAPSK